MSASARDAILIAEAFKALGKAVKRKAYESDSDDYIEQATNRGSKLKKRARFVRRGQIGPNGPPLFREAVEHAGYQRAVISRNPTLVDEEGYEIDSDDDEERVVEAQAEADEVNPYASIRLEDILAPLTSSADLANHATLSRPFLSTALSELSIQGRNLMHKENKALWNVRPLLTRLCGDHTWASCNMMLGPNDADLFDIHTGGAPQHRRPQNRKQAPAPESHKPASPPMPNGAAPKTKPPGHTDQKAGSDEAEDKQTDPDVTMEDIDPADVSATTGPGAVNGDKPAEDASKIDVKMGDYEKAASGKKDKHAATSMTNGGLSAAAPAAGKRPLEPGEKNSAINGDPVTVNGLTAVNKGIQQHDAANAPLEVNGSGTTLAGDPEVIHPYFLAPASAYPDRDAGLPQQDAEDVRRLLQLYVQKQEEVCRGTKELYEGLLRADRLRQMVLKWSKAEAHCGANRDMSDGEDWYDKDEWGLAEDLKKGQDEEEEDTTKDQPKKTRNRR
ncbi:hypothetical protein MAPG_05864 [Magnaporthiopsis poae ATCC 64411]|uniref:Transcriptional regulatory protein RXT2 N-terminal domain-containing protein n=1 Tax=Magnaporthiopsis poae (strain ATCC 64411 / 73-15) TaxID=644358 RepID=A0A0C4E0I9_MAGP6|nr:hypothetical protein MAPG_05864 [Magnaporthiopsis poae ATCC 64411]